MIGRKRLSDRALNRALLARQGLLERFDAPLVEVVEAIGAMQGQAWGALPVGLWSRMTSFAPEDLYGALERGDLHWGIGVRGTLHLVSAHEHPAYAVVAEAGSTGSWHRAIEETTPAMDELRAGVLDFAAPQARSNEEIRQFVEAWVSEHPEAIDPREMEAQRSLKWRPIYRWSALTRAPAGGAWGAKAPGDHGRTLYDLPEAPRPDPETPAPPRLLGAFDSTLLAYAAKRRERIIPEALHDVVFQKANLQIRPTFLVDGLVAGTWSIEVRRREASLTLRPAAKLAGPVRTGLTAEATGLLKALQPAAKAHHVAEVSM